MFIDTEKYPFLGGISDRHNTIRREFFRAAKKNQPLGGALHGRTNYIDQHLDEWVDENGFHPDQIGYDIRGGSYSGFSLYKEGKPNTISLASSFDKTMALLGTIPKLHFAAFVIMTPGALLKEHAHSQSRLIFHTLLNDLVGGKCKMTCGGDVRSLAKAGDSVLFNYSIPHSSVNHASNNRINLIIDFEE